jgi:hypothetical protein
MLFVKVLIWQLGESFESQSLAIFKGILKRDSIDFEILF